jgi:hypothetical protein
VKALLPRKGWTLCLSHTFSSVPPGPEGTSSSAGDARGIMQSRRARTIDTIIGKFSRISDLVEQKQNAMKERKVSLAGMVRVLRTNLAEKNFEVFGQTLNQFVLLVNQQNDLSSDARANFFSVMKEWNQEIHPDEERLRVLRNFVVLKLSFTVEERNRIHEIIDGYFNDQAKTATSFSAFLLIAKILNYHWDRRKLSKVIERLDPATVEMTGIEYSEILSGLSNIGVDWGKDLTQNAKQSLLSDRLEEMNEKLSGEEIARVIHQYGQFEIDLKKSLSKTELSAFTEMVQKALEFTQSGTDEAEKARNVMKLFFFFYFSSFSDSSNYRLLS